MTPSFLPEDQKTDKAAVEFSRPLRLSASQDLKSYLASHIGRFILLLLTLVSLLVVLLIFWFIIQKALPFLADYGFKAFLTDLNWNPKATPPAFGSVSLLAGSIYVTTVSLIIAVPLGVLAAVFLSDMAPFNVQQIIKPLIEVLAAIPSVAYGFFAILVLAPWLQNTMGLRTGANILNASVLLAIMALPTIISVAEDSLSAIGREIREASYGLGATRAETIIKVVIPSASSGIVAGVILGMMRAIGETMVVYMASGNVRQFPSPWWDITQSVQTMTATIIGEMGETGVGTDHRKSLFAIGFLLLTFTFVLNIISEYFISKVKRSRGKS